MHRQVNKYMSDISEILIQSVMCCIIYIQVNTYIQINDIGSPRDMYVMETRMYNVTYKIIKTEKRHLFGSVNTDVFLCNT